MNGKDDNITKFMRIFVLDFIFTYESWYNNYHEVSWWWHINDFNCYET